MVTALALKLFLINDINMSETLTPIDLVISRGPSRFGDVDAHLETMKNGDYFVIHGSIDEFLMVPAHRNEVNLAEVGFEDADNKPVTSEPDDISTILPNSPAHRNFVELMRLSSERETILSVHKPSAGESQEAKGDIGHCCVREETAFDISSHFNLDIVPPTINRDGGSCQLLMDPNRYVTAGDDSEGTGEQMDSAKIRGSLDYQKIALLDWLILGVDRRMSNYMVNLEDQEELIAIDNGLSLGSNLYRDATMLYGPTTVLTSEHNPARKKDKIAPELLPVVNQMSPELVSLLQNGLANRDVLNQKLKDAAFKRNIEDPKTGDFYEKSYPEFTHEEINQFWKRVELAAEKGVFISRGNFEAVTGISLNDPRSREYF